MSTTPPITNIQLPRHEGESPRAYDARVRYVTMGPSRSIDKVADQLGYKSATRPGRLIDWSSRYEWVESARRYDEAVAYLTVQDAASDYRAKLEEQRVQAFAIGTEMIDAAREMLAQAKAQFAAMDYRPSDMATISKVFTTGFELRSHSLNIDGLIEHMEPQS